MTPKEQWIAALRSGDYKQGKNLLNVANDRFCCLGVACDLAAAAGLPIEVRTKGEWVTYNGNAFALPSIVQEWLGLTGGTGAYAAGYLASDNDHHDHSFAQIAETIETHPEMFA